MITGKSIEQAKIHGRRIVDAIATKNYSEIENLVDDMVDWNTALCRKLISATL